MRACLLVSLHMPNVTIYSVWMYISGDHYHHHYHHRGLVCKINLSLHLLTCLFTQNRKNKRVICGKIKTTKTNANSIIETYNTHIHRHIVATIFNTSSRRSEKKKALEIRNNNHQCVERLTWIYEHNAQCNTHVSELTRFQCQQTD